MGTWTVLGQSENCYLWMERDGVCLSFLKITPFVISQSA